jgi:hypothetical protein
MSPSATAAAILGFDMMADTRRLSEIRIKRGSKRLSMDLCFFQIACLKNSGVVARTVLDREVDGLSKCWKMASDLTFGTCEWIRILPYGRVEWLTIFQMPALMRNSKVPVRL